MISLLVNCESQATSENSLAWSIGLGAIGAAPLLGLTLDLARDRHLRKKDARDGASPTFTALTIGAAYGGALFVLGSYVGDAPPYGLPATALALAVLVLLGSIFAIGHATWTSANRAGFSDYTVLPLATGRAAVASAPSLCT